MADIEGEPSDIIDEFEPTGSNQSGMRDRNERLVLTLLRRQGPLPKAQIARKTGLSPQTVSVIMRALEQDGLLEKGEKLRGKVGQPSVPMRLAPGGALFFGVKVGRRSAEITLVNFVGKELAQRTRTYAYPTPGETIAFVTSSVAEICADLPAGQRDRLSGMGIACPFFLWEWAETIGVAPAKMAAWKGFDLCAEVSKQFEFPVYLGNDATSACGAELVFGTTETPPEFLYIYIGYFIGGGVVLNGALYAGRSQNAGAIGTFPIASGDGTHHQLVDSASLIGLERRVMQHTGDASPMQTQQDTWDIDPVVVEDWLNAAVPSLAQMIVGALSIIDFPTVLIDGNMPETLRTQVVDRVTDALSDLPMSGLFVPAVLPGSLGPRARPLGAASLPLSKRFMLET